MPASFLKNLQSVGLCKIAGGFPILHLSSLGIRSVRRGQCGDWGASRHLAVFDSFMWVDEVELSCGLPNDFFVLDFCWISPGGGGGENFDFELHQFPPPNWQRIGCTFTIIHDKTTTCLRNYSFQAATIFEKCSPCVRPITFQSDVSAWE